MLRLGDQQYRISLPNLGEDRRSLYIYIYTCDDDDNDNNNDTNNGNK